MHIIGSILSYHYKRFIDLINTKELSSRTALTISNPFIAIIIMIIIIMKSIAVKIVVSLWNMVVERKNHHNHHAMVLFTFLVISSLLLTELYIRFIHQHVCMPLHTTVFLILFCGVWVFLDNIVLGIDLIETKAKIQKAEKKIQILTNDLRLSDRKTEKNTTQWFTILTFSSNSNRSMSPINS
jgi:hypothetical protein